MTHDLAGLADDVVFTQEFTANSMRSLLSAAIGATADFETIFYYDNLSRMVQITQQAQGSGGGYNAVAEKLVDLAYLADGRFDAILRYADLARTDLVAESSYAYDGAGRIDSLDHFKDATTFAGYAWAYNAANRVTAFTNSEHSAEDSTFGYDDFGQITSADRDGTSNDEGYTYDDNGNRTGGGYATGPYNRITSDGTYDYEYDDEGNIVLRTRISDDYYTEYEWDHRNRLIGVTDFDDEETQLQQVTYTYDAFNRLVSRTLQIGTDPAVTGYFIYDGHTKNIVLALDDSGDVEQRLLWGPAVDQILADESIPDGETYWLLDDNLGTVRDVAIYDAGQDETTIANHLFYDAFGRRVSETDDTLSLVDLGYTGRYFDRATSLQWNNARWYNASIGRWMSEDWIRDDINTYRYVRNSATNLTDPSGLNPPAEIPLEGGGPPIDPDTGKAGVLDPAHFPYYPFTFHDLLKLLKESDKAYRLYQELVQSTKEWTGDGRAARPLRIRLVTGMELDGLCDYRKRTISINRDRPIEEVVQTLLFELLNMKNRDMAMNIAVAAYTGKLSREDYIRANEYLEYITMKEFKAIGEELNKNKPNIWGPNSIINIISKDFEDWYSDLTPEHKEHYGRLWDENIKEAYEKEQARK